MNDITKQNRVRAKKLVLQNERSFDLRKCHHLHMHNNHKFSVFACMKKKYFTIYPDLPFEEQWYEFHFLNANHFLVTPPGVQSCFLKVRNISMCPYSSTHDFSHIWMFYQPFWPIIRSFYFQNKYFLANEKLIATVQHLYISVKATWWYKYMHHCITQNLLYIFQLTMEQSTGVDGHWFMGTKYYCEQDFEKLEEKSCFWKDDNLGIPFLFSMKSMIFIFKDVVYKNALCIKTKINTLQFKKLYICT